MTSNVDVGFNTDELQPPDWINDEFFIKVLSKCERETGEVRVISTKISPATMRGDHYASVMFRALVEYRLDGVSETKSLIIKTMRELDGHKKEMIGQMDIFEKEIDMYTVVLPRFEKILRTAGDDTVLKAPCLYYSLNPKQVIVFQDLVPLGYEVLRDRHVNEKEVKAAYAKLAKWHAISYKINIEEPHYFDKYQRGIFSTSNFMEQGFVKSGITNFIEMLPKVPSLREYLPYFQALQPILLTKCRETFVEFHESPRDDAFYVLCHGDFHTKNMMFKHNAETGKLVDVMLLDYQVGYVGPILNDIIYSIYCMLDESLRLIFPEFLYYYHTIFTETLKKIGYENCTTT